MRNEFSHTEEILDNQSRIRDFINNYQLRNLPSATVDSKDGVVLEVNCFPAAAEIYTNGFVERTIRAAVKISGFSDSSKLDVILVTEDFTRHFSYLQNAEKWFNDLSCLDFIANVKRKTFRELEEINADMVISNSDLRVKEAAQKIIDSKIPCFPSPYAGWWIRSKIGTCKQIDNLCSKIRIDSKTVQPDYKYVLYDKFDKNVIEQIKLKTSEMLDLYPCGVFVKQATGTQGYGCMHISSSDDYDKKEVFETLAFKRGFRGSRIDGILIQKCMSSLKYPLQVFDEKLNLIKEEERAAELYFIMVADNSLSPSIQDIFIRIGPANSFHNINRPGEIFKNLQQHDLVAVKITNHDVEAAALAAQLAYAATDIQVQELKLDEINK